MSNMQRAMPTVYGDLGSVPSVRASCWSPPPAETRVQRYPFLAARLNSAVHDILGRTRDGRSRLPGATEANPVAGGLRIGKEDEVGKDSYFQYHHYLTLWMFAMNRMALASQDEVYNDLAIALAESIPPAFVYERQSARPRVYWKVAMYLSKPLVLSEGNLDPMTIDGYVVYTLLQHTAGTDVLQSKIEDYRKILESKWSQYPSDDPLDLGMTLWTAHWLRDEEEWANALTKKALACLFDIWDDGYFNAPRRYRLPFHEFGTGLGIQCNEGTKWKERARSIISFCEETQHRYRRRRKSMQLISSRLSTASCMRQH
ncbi:hypothetical protein CALCODRAFT_538057 [Calocera cornea HHB12733]|uniref:Uncharacterized protein n=1 Tax=Calocera cornea HHB12733 TaxID=1353952 RepID=A0A165C1W1_9BASI|nr:hypothetical protein CALCODRAFT_538057 [Calocera cornea HHB12733]